MVTAEQQPNQQPESFSQKRIAAGLRTSGMPRVTSDVLTERATKYLEAIKEVRKSAARASHPEGFIPQIEPNS